MKTFIAFWALAHVTFGQDAPDGLRIRAVLHDPIRPFTDLYIADAANEQGIKLPLVAEGLCAPQQVTPLNGSLVIYQAPGFDAANPKANVAAIAKVPAATRLIVVILPAAAGSDYPYNLHMIEDSKKAFPYGGSKVVNATGVDFALEVGEHKIPLVAGKVSAVPAVRKLDEYNRAQTNFYFRKGESWETFTERQMQYVDTMRRIFLIYSTPGATQPAFRTIVDYAPVKMPE